MGRVIRAQRKGPGGIFRVSNTGTNWIDLDVVVEDEGMDGSSQQKESDKQRNALGFSQRENIYTNRHSTPKR